MKFVSDLKEFCDIAHCSNPLSVYNVEHTKEIRPLSHSEQNKRDIGANCRSLEDKASLILA